MNANFEEDRWRDSEFKLGPHSYRGRSVGSEGTCHQFPGYGVCFDIGGAPMSATAIPRVFITHGHEDHIGGLVKHAVRRDGRGLSPATYYVAEDDVLAAQALHRVQMGLSRAVDADMLNICPIKVGDEVPVGGNLVVRPFQSLHRIPCLGYALWSKRRKIKAEYQGVAGSELKRLREEGVAIDEELVVPEVAFPGDTSMRVYATDAGDVLRQARVLLLECTFVDDEVPPRQAYRTGHIHIDDVIELDKAGHFDKNEVILLTHFSARYTSAHIRQWVALKLQDTSIHDRVVVHVPGGAP